MFAKLAFTELRADRGVCTAECGTYACLKGGPGEPPPSPGGDRGLPTAGCPLHSHPASLVDNRDCTLCGSCARGCAHANVALRLRPPGADLWGAHNATDSEVALMFLLLGALGVHHGGEVAAALGIDGWFGDGWLRANPSALPPSLFWPRAGLASALLLAPWALCAAADAAAGAAAGAWARARPPAAAAAAAAQQPQPPFTRLAYGWLPLVWAASLAHYTSLFASEAGLVLPRLADGLYLPHFVADALPRAVLAPSAAAFLQAAALVGGGGAATALTVALGRQGAYAPARVAAQLAGVAAAGAALWGLIVTEPFLAAPG